MRADSKPAGSLLVIEGESLFQIVGPKTSTDLPSRVVRRADDLMREPLVAHPSPRLPGLCGVLKHEQYMETCFIETVFIIYNLILLLTKS